MLLKGCKVRFISKRFSVRLMHSEPHDEGVQPVNFTLYLWKEKPTFSIFF